MSAEPPNNVMSVLGSCPPHPHNFEEVFDRVALILDEESPAGRRYVLGFLLFATVSGARATDNTKEALGAAAAAAADHYDHIMNGAFGFRE